ncbi:MAG TPA: glycine--tRNA ligase subunit beta [Terriglobia bacterium]|nr:glycine--tRNA ligase subunit beta [Terriglobia bacterium]
MSQPETTALVLEIGSEEIPARFLEGAERDFGERLGSALGEARLLPEGATPVVKTASTPRRLIAYAPQLLTKQPGRREEIIGPPVKVAFDKEGKPTRAAESFAAKNNAKVSDLKRVTNAKGEYLAVELAEPGRDTLEVLHEMLPAVIAGMTFPKNMYWTAKSGPFFVRPIRWILALMGDQSDIQIVPFEFAGVQSGNATYGHRLEGSQPLRVAHLDLDHLLKEHQVVVHGAERRERVQRGIKALLEGTGMKAVADDFLESWVVNSTEWPVALMGSFDKRYLALPREVLITVMRDHQKYFAVEDKAGNLQPHFITVLNVPGDPKGLIRRGHERVLAARFADAEFFWNADQKMTLAERIPMLERVTYQAKLGTYADKVRRTRALAEKICGTLELAGQMNGEERRDALRAVELCKCDLTTQMVQEFTELQGVIGGLYAKAQGEPEGVAAAIYDHYRPAGLEDACPRSVAGDVVSLADKLDSVVAGFSAGLEPTGSSDPFGLRRAGNGIVKVMVEALPESNLEALLGAALEMDLGLAVADGLGISDFFRERLGFYLEASGAKYDTVRAVVNSGWSVPSQAVERARALEAVRDSEDFAALAMAAKRTRNILHKSAEAVDYGATGEIQSDLLEPGPERDLYHAFLDMRDRLARSEAEGDFVGGFRTLSTLRPKVDAFFDKVLVMDPDARIRANRLKLLSDLNALVFLKLADLSEIANVGAPTLTGVDSAPTDRNS